MKRRKEKHIIVGVHVTDRARHAAEVHKVLASYGTHIRTRVGLHETDGRISSPEAVILLEMAGNEKKCFSIIAALNTIAGVEAQKIVFGH